MNYFLACFLISVSYVALVGGQVCPAGGIACWPSDCCTQYKQCSGTTFWPAQSAPSGTVCLQGQFVWPYQCTTPCSSSSPTSAPPTSAPPATKPAPTNTKPSNPTTAPTVKPNPTSGGSCSLASIFTQADFNVLFPNANGGAAHNIANQAAIFSYSAIIQAAASFPTFGCTGDNATRYRELAAFLAQTSQESSGWWAGQLYNWGYYYSSEISPPSNYCDPSNTVYPCVAGQSYFGRGPLQLSWNYNYGQVSLALFNDKTVLLNNPGLVLTDPVVAFKTALWFWMTTQAPKPSCHDVMTGVWTPSASDVAAGRVAGFGMVTNIVNGGIECSSGSNSAGSINRVGYYELYCIHFGITDGGNVYCSNMGHY